jgi:N-acetylmuramoyl-L-alanine amidase
MSEIAVLGTPVPFIPSPNRVARPAGVVPRCIVLHSTCCAHDVARRWLCSPASKVSAHFLVARDGSIEQLVRLADVAWHAGVSYWRGQSGVNRVSIGIEMVHMDGADDWPLAQLRAVAALCRVLMARYRLSPDVIVSHATVARPKGRKVDPVAFPWEGFRGMVAG